MDAGPLRDVLTVVIGIGTGVLSAAFGVGGAVVSTPAVRALGLPALLAVGTTLPSVLPSAVSGTNRYVREHMVDWRVVAWTAPVGVASAVGGSLLSHEVPGEGHVLMIITALLLGFNAYRMARASEPVPRPPKTDAREKPRWVAIGAIAGTLSGLLGVGGGVVMVPAFVEWARIPLKTAIATSLACVAMFAIPGTITHALLGGIDWRVALLLTIGVIPGARLGAAATIRSKDNRLRVAVALFLGTVSLLYLIGELIALAD